MTSFVLDASAILAVINQEPGFEKVAAVQDQSLISAVNLAEVITRLADHKIPEDEINKILGVLGLKVIDFTFSSAQLMTTLRNQTSHLGLSLGDRACLALAIEQKLPVLTADRAWKKLKIGIEIQVIR